MFTNQTKTSSISSMSKWFRRVPWLVLPVMLLAFSIAHAQQLTATLSGIVTDQTDARVPGARVVVVNEASGDTRETKADDQGFCSVTALVPGTYKVTDHSQKLRRLGTESNPPQPGRQPYASEHSPEDRIRSNGGHCYFGRRCRGSGRYGGNQRNLEQRAG